MSQNKFNTYCGSVSQNKSSTVRIIMRYRPWIGSATLWKVEQTQCHRCPLNSIVRFFFFLFFLFSFTFFSIVRSFVHARLLQFVSFWRQPISFSPCKVARVHKRARYRQEQRACQCVVVSSFVLVVVKREV